MAYRFPGTNYQPQIRCAVAQNGLAAGQTFSNGDIRYECHAIAGRARVKARALFTIGGGNLDLLFVGPDLDLDRLAKDKPTWANLIASYGLNNAAPTIYATGSPVAVLASVGVEAQIYADCYGEGYVIVRLTANANGTIGFVDIMRV